jgi:hypothetical protein
MTKIIKDFPDYTISTKGIVIKIKTNKELSIWIGANGYKHVDLRKDGKGIKVALHRLLAIAFIDNPNNKRTVNHIDGNKLNNNLENLEWATDSENVKHAYNNGLQPYRREYLLETYNSMLVNKFLKGETITSIAKNSKNCITQISLHLRESAERLNLLKEYEAELVRQKAERNKQTGKSQRKQIVLNMLDKNTEEVLQTFDSVTEAKEFLQKKSCGPISNVLAGRQKTAYGYKWEKV